VTTRLLPNEKAMQAAQARDGKTNFDHMLEYWLGDYRPTEPQPSKSGLPFIWKWADLRSIIYPTGSSMDIAEAERRGFALVNPSLEGRPYMTNTLYSDLQMLRGGERCTAHRHTSSASRFVLEGPDVGGYTVIDGERMEMGRGDLVITPNWTWHHHGNEGDKEIIYLNILDIPVVTYLGAVFNDLDYRKMRDEEQDYQSVQEPAGLSEALYGSGGLVPRFVSSRPDGLPLKKRDAFTSKYYYPWKRTHETLQSLKKYPGSPYDGIVVEYVNPRTGGPVIPTMSFNMQLLRAGEHTLAHRQTSSAIYVVHEGHGYTMAGDQRIEWGKNDIFAIPPWVWHHHVNLQSATDSTLLMVTDQPMVKAMGCYREEGRTAKGDVILVERNY
jgi:gentisate 1,2-dioxygenase